MQNIAIYTMVTYATIVLRVYPTMARPDPNGLIELDGEIFIGYPPARRLADTSKHPKAHNHYHRHQRAASIQMRLDLDGRTCVVCGKPIPIERQANTLFCERRGSCARGIDNIRRRTAERLSRPPEEMRELYQRLFNEKLHGAARKSAITTILLWLKFNGPNVRQSQNSAFNIGPKKLWKW